MYQITFNIYRYPKDYKIYSHEFDYFDYSGINRAVQLYTTPKVYVCDINVLTSFGNNSEGNAYKWYIKIFYICATII